MDHAIRSARVDDADAMGEVVVRAWQAAYRGIMPDDYLDGLRAEDRAEWWRGAVASLPPERHIRVLTVGADVVGFAASGPEAAEDADGRTGELYAINLDPNHWRKGLGRALLGDVTRGLVDAGYQSAVLWVAVGNERARSFFESEGWTAEDVSRDADVLGVTVRVARHRKQLDE
jgi:ribosomal protein S18 acetylase RimI-like enzyme